MLQIGFLEVSALEQPSAVFVVRPWHDADVGDGGFSPLSPYVEFVWLPVAGPTTMDYRQKMPTHMITGPYGHMITGSEGAVVRPVEFAAAVGRSKSSINGGIAMCWPPPR